MGTTLIFQISQIHIGRRHDFIFLFRFIFIYLFI